MSIEILPALVATASVVIIVIALGFGLELIRKDKVVQDGAVLLAITGFVICGLYFLNH